jgi:KDO2-lipid IV(A) lauroyltransferase
MKSSTSDKSPYHPQYWPLWIAMGLLWIIIQSPYRWQLTLGKTIGLIALHLAKRERRTAEINLEKCFPHLSLMTRNQLLRESFISMGIGFLETIFGWWAPHWRINKLLHITGIEHINNALHHNQGVLICGQHFSSIHLVGRLLNFIRPFAVMYFPPKNPVIKKISENALRRHYKLAIRRDDARSMIKALKQNLPIFYTPDTDAGPKNSIFAPFFGISAATVTATARFAQITGCAVNGINYWRRSNGKGYEVQFSPPLENYPTTNPLADATRINQLIEQAILQHPEQYLWQYKRFKTRPPGEVRFYAKN